MGQWVTITKQTKKGEKFLSQITRPLERADWRQISSLQKASLKTVFQLCITSAFA